MLPVVPVVVLLPLVLCFVGALAALRNNTCCVDLQATRSNTSTEEEAKSTSEQEEADSANEEAESPLAARTTRHSTANPLSPQLKTALVKGRHRLRKAA